MNTILYGLGGTTFTFFMTTLGAALVFFFRKSVSDKIQKTFLGFAAGVMVAASVWSLLIPGIDSVESQGGIGWIPAAGGFILGGLFLLGLDKVLPHLHPGSDTPEGMPSSLRRTTLLILAVTLHNIPEGMAVGVAFALAAQQGGIEGSLAAAVTLAIGIGIQNFPEGAAIALPLKQEGMPAWKAFLFGSLSGIVEPIFGVLTILVVGSVTPILPWLLSFAAGAMIFVVVEELIPEAQLGEHTHIGTFGVMAGFVVMMVLDVALG